MSDSKERARREREADLRGVMSTPAGRRFVWRLIDADAGVLRHSHAGEALATAFNEGRRALGISLLQEVQKVTPADYVRMVGEHLSTHEDGERQRKLERRDDGADG